MIKIEQEVKKIETKEFDTYYEFLYNRLCLGKYCTNCPLRAQIIHGNCTPFIHKLADRMSDEVKRNE